MAEIKPIPTSSTFQDLTGRVIGSVSVIGFVGSNERRQAKWLCRCKCGKEIITWQKVLVRGFHAGCGCWRAGQGTTHGMSRTPTYSSWQRMIDRCTNAKNKHFENYGGRGVVICHRWRISFKNFLDDMGIRPDGTSLDRVNNDGNYEPGNCRWATRSQQQSNRRVNHLITINGETRTITQWSLVSGISTCTISSRIRLGWKHEDAVFMALNQGHYRRSTPTTVT